MSDSPAVSNVKVVVASIFAAGIILAALNLRPAITSIAPILKEVSDAVRLSALDQSLLGALPPIVFAVAGIASAVFGNRLGLERSLLLATFMAMIGIVLRASSSDAATFLTATVLIMTGIGVANVVIPPLIKRYFQRNIASMTMAYNISLVIGQAIPPFLVVPLYHSFGWRIAVGIWAMIALLSAIPWLISRKIWVDDSRSATHPDDRNTKANEIGIRDVLTSKVTIGMTLLLITNTTANYCLMAWLPQIMISAGESTERASHLFAVFAVGCLIGSLLIAPIVTRMKKPFPMLLFMLGCWMIGLLGLILFPTHGTLTWLLISRIGDGFFPATITFIGLRTKSSASAAVLSSVAQSFNYFTSGIGCFLFGTIYAITQSFHAPLAMLMVFMLLTGTTGAFLMAKPYMLEDTITTR